MTATGLKRLVFVLIYAVLVVIHYFYFQNKYEVADMRIKSVSVVTNVDYNDLLLYNTAEHEGQLAYNTLKKPDKPGDTLVFRFRQPVTRNFRLYFGRASDTNKVKSVWLETAGGVELLADGEFKKSGINISAVVETAFGFTNVANGFLELKKTRVNTAEYRLAMILIFAVPLLFTFFFRWVLKTVLKGGYYSYSDWAPSLFFAGIFLPHPWFNVMLILSGAIIVRRFRFSVLAGNKTGMLFLSLFLVYVLNDFFVSAQFYPPILETLLPMLILPLYFACLRRTDYEPFLLASAIVLGCVFASTSLLDFSVYRNSLCFSFNYLTSYVHPVYFSYLLFFGVVYSYFRLENFTRFLSIGILLVLMLMAGSKIVISLAVVFIITRLWLRPSKLAFLAIAAVFVLMAILEPTRARFMQIITSSSSVEAASSGKAEKLDGLSIRLLIWQESLRTESMGRLFFGSGLGQQARGELAARLSARGLKGGLSAYDPHNQFIATYYHTGLFGLIVLLAICVYVYRIAWRIKSDVAKWTCLLFLVAMTTESLLHRVTGIYLFCSLLLLHHLHYQFLFRFENSDSGHERGA